MKFKQLLLCSTFLGIISINATAQSNTWPNTVIKLIVPFVPGSFTDTAARVLSVELAKQLGQTVISLGGTSQNAVSIGRITTLNTKESGVGTTSAKPKFLASWRSTRNEIIGLFT